MGESSLSPPDYLKRPLRRSRRIATVLLIATSLAACSGEEPPSFVDDALASENAEEMERLGVPGINAAVGRADVAGDGAEDNVVLQLSLSQFEDALRRSDWRFEVCTNADATSGYWIRKRSLVFAPYGTTGSHVVVVLGAFCTKDLIAYPTDGGQPSNATTILDMGRTVAVIVLVLGALLVGSYIVVLAPWALVVGGLSALTERGRKSSESESRSPKAVPKTRSRPNNDNNTRRLSLAPTSLERERTQRAVAQRRPEREIVERPEQDRISERQRQDRAYGNDDTTPRQSRHPTDQPRERRPPRSERFAQGRPQRWGHASDALEEARTLRAAGENYVTSHFEWAYDDLCDAFDRTAQSLEAIESRDLGAAAPEPARPWEEEYRAHYQTLKGWLDYANEHFATEIRELAHRRREDERLEIAEWLTPELEAEAEAERRLVETARRLELAERRRQVTATYIEAHKSNFQEPLDPRRHEPDEDWFYVDLHGYSKGRARLVVLEAIDEAWEWGLPLLHVLHGKGTGALRQITADVARTHPAVDASHNGANPAWTTLELLASDPRSTTVRPLPSPDLPDRPSDST
jgi:DNA-nicking Smr family endonuclease